MRRLAFVLLLLSAVPAHAVDVYENARFGYAIEVPESFEPQGESQNGDGQVFRGGRGTQVLTVFGGNALDGFAAEAAARRQFAIDDGWNLTYEASTPGWAVWSGVQGSRILYVRIISLCGGTQFALFEIVYSNQAAAELRPVVSRLGQSLTATGRGQC